MKPTWSIPNKMKAFKCVNKINGQYYDFQMNEITPTLPDEYCCLSTYQQAKTLHDDWLEDTVECERPRVYNCILEIDIIPITTTWFGIVNDTLFAQTYNIVGEVFAC